MITAHDLRNSVFFRHDGKIYKVLDQNSHAGGGKAGSTVHVKMRDVASGHVIELKLDPHEKIEDLEVERRKMRFLYADGDDLCFMDPESFEQIQLTKEAVGHLTPYLLEETEVEVEFFDGSPIHVTPPEKVTLKVVSTGTATKGATDNVYKDATLEGGAQILVPHFIKTGDQIVVHVETGKYIDRVKGS